MCVFFEREEWVLILYSCEAHTWWHPPIHHFPISSFPVPVLETLALHTDTNWCSSYGWGMLCYKVSCTGKCCNSAAEDRARVVIKAHLQMPFSFYVNFIVCSSGVSQGKRQMLLYVMISFWYNSIIVCMHVCKYM